MLLFLPNSSLVLSTCFQLLLADFESALKAPNSQYPFSQVPFPLHCSSCLKIRAAILDLSPLTHTLVFLPKSSLVLLTCFQLVLSNFESKPTVQKSREPFFRGSILIRFSGCLAIRAAILDL
ncbi:hypothetical protein HanHA300_Chr02g0059081 [Helianthus annuus]|nr:hypothetical protein HanHA300_Chr02g0059081 [Helianthus annuus]KAJ0619111.1 hypothetical protein HanHA89_Chr02g0067631 [Helianthus annuus]KAJ0777559.1 hypothetical protein HanLR1_Chr02g0061821 [Helianthus annuus]KAJ0786593.1 hypothetical protein HanOQP8_Chr02g0073001 [Helianthus annuus]